MSNSTLKAMLPATTTGPISPRAILPASEEIDRSNPERAVAPIVDQIISSYAGMVGDRLRTDAALTRAREGVLMALRANPGLWAAAVGDAHGLSVAIIKSLRLGLDLDPTLGHAYIVPRRARKGEPVKLQLEIGYRGMIHLARQAGIVEIFAEVVYSVDGFEVLRGTENRLTHRPSYLEPRSEAVAVYAVAKLANGGTEFEVLTLAEIAAARAKSTARDGSAWRDHWPEMAKKTALRRLFKRLPVRLVTDGDGDDDPSSPPAAVATPAAAPRLPQAPAEPDPASLGWADFDADLEEEEAP